MQDCPNNCSYAGACVLWNGAPEGWYEAPLPAPEAAIDSIDASPKAGSHILILRDASDTSGGNGSAAAAARRQVPEYPICACFPGLGVSSRQPADCS